MSLCWVVILNTGLTQSPKSPGNQLRNPGGGNHLDHWLKGLCLVWGRSSLEGGGGDFLQGFWKALGEREVRHGLDSSQHSLRNGMKTTVFHLLANCLCLVYLFFLCIMPGDLEY